MACMCIHVKSHPHYKKVYMYAWKANQYSLCNLEKGDFLKLNFNFYSTVLVRLVQLKMFFFLIKEEPEKNHRAARQQQAGVATGKWFL